LRELRTVEDKGSRNFVPRRRTRGEPYWKERGVIAGPDREIIALSALKVHFCEGVRGKANRVLHRGETHKGGHGDQTI